MLYSKYPQILINLEFPLSQNHKNLDENYETTLHRRIGKIVSTFKDSIIITNRNVDKVQDFQKERQAKLKQHQQFNIGDIILVYDSGKQNIHGNKFAEKWLGPMWIIKKIGENVYRVRDKLGKEIPADIHTA